MNSPGKPAESVEPLSHRDRSLRQTLALVRARRRKRQTGLAAGVLSTLLVTAALISLHVGNTEPNPPPFTAQRPEAEPDDKRQPESMATSGPLIERIQTNELVLIRLISSAPSIPRVGQIRKSDRYELIQLVNTEALILALSSQPSGSILVHGLDNQIQLVRFN